MQKIIVNRIKILCSKGRIEKGETVILPESEVEQLNSLRGDTVTILETVSEAPKVAQAVKKVATKATEKIGTKRKRARNADGTLKGDDPSTPNVNEAWHES